jgi:hypothetical protein
MMITFLTTIADDVERCRHSLRYRELITISAAVDGTNRIINGVVNIIEPVRGVDVPAWKISVYEAPPSSQPPS